LGRSSNRIYSKNKKIELWEICNKEVHGVSNEEIEGIRKERVSKEIQGYFNFKDDVLLCDTDLFPENPDEFIKKKTSKELQEWISINKRWIYKSINRKENGDLGSTQILRWLQSNPKNDEKKIKRAKENRRRQVNIKEARRIAKRDKEKKQRKENKQPKEQHPKNKLIAHNFTTTPKKLTNKQKIERALAALN